MIYTLIFRNLHCRVSSGSENHSGIFWRLFSQLIAFHNTSTWHSIHIIGLHSNSLICFACCGCCWFCNASSRPFLYLVRLSHNRWDLFLQRPGIKNRGLGPHGRGRFDPDPVRPFRPEPRWVRSALSLGSSGRFHPPTARRWRSCHVITSRSQSWFTTRGPPVSPCSIRPSGIFVFLLFLVLIDFFLLVLPVTYGITRTLYPWFPSILRWLAATMK